MFSSLGKKVAKILQDDKDTELSTASQNKIRELIDIDFPSFAGILPYRYFWREKNLFINAGSLGFGMAWLLS